MRGFIDDYILEHQDDLALRSLNPRSCAASSMTAGEEMEFKPSKSQSAFVRGFIDDYRLAVNAARAKRLVSIRVRARLHR